MVLNCLPQMALEWIWRMVTNVRIQPLRRAVTGTVAVG